MTHPGSGHRSGRKSGGSEIQRVSSDALGHGLTIAAAIGLFLWAGDKADRALGTSPLFALSGALTGAAAAFYRLYAHLMAAQDRKDDSDPKDGAE